MHTRHDRSLSIYTLTSRTEKQNARTLFARLSLEHPVHWDPYAGTWLISGREEALTACTAKEFSASRMATAQRSTEQADRVQDALARQLLFLDDKAHTDWRRAIRPLFASKRVDALTPWIETRISELIEAADHDHFEIVDSLARPLPCETSAKFLGLPLNDAREIAVWSDAYTRAVTGFEPKSSTPDSIRIAEFMDYAVDLVRHRQRSPRDDGLGLLIAGAGAVGITDVEDIAANLIMLIAAGHQTTTGFLAGAVVEHLRPEFGPLDAPSTETAVEDLLARVSPSRFIGRQLSEDTELGAHRMLAGQSVLILLAAVNWHESTQPSTTTRRAASNLAFGYGSHRCPGARIARLEGRLVLERLFGGRQAPTLSPQPVRWSDNVNLPCPLRVSISLEHRSQ